MGRVKQAYLAIVRSQITLPVRNFTISRVRCQLLFIMHGLELGDVNAPCVPVPTHERLTGFHVQGCFYRAYANRGRRTARVERPDNLEHVLAT